MSEVKTSWKFKTLEIMELSSLLVEYVMWDGGGFRVCGGDFVELGKKKSEKI